MNNAPEQIFLPSSSGTHDQPGLPKPGNGPQAVNLDSVEEFSKVCRVCAAVSELVMPIFSGEGLQNNLADKIHKHLPIKVSESDSPSLPVVVCYQCASTLLATHELVQCAAQADAALRTRSAALAAAAAPAAPAARRKEENLQAAQERDTGEGNAQGERRCAFCPARLPRGQYRAHLERRHAALVFHCAECDRYLSRRVLLLHMTAHAAHYDEAARRARPRPRPRPDHTPTPTPAQQLASALQSLLVPTRPQEPDAPAKTGTPIRSDPTETEALIKPDHPVRCNTEDKIENEAQNVIPSVPVTPAPDLTQAASICSPVSAPATDFAPPSSSNQPVIVLSAVTVPTPATASSPAMVTASLPETAIGPTAVRDEFSDHSDAESDFGPLPDSVFSAIEDPPDVIPTTAKVEKEKEVEANKTNRKRERACPHCDKKYFAASSYFYHLKYFHLRSREHACTVCGASFGTRGTLREHARLHSPERSLQCACCGKRFRSKAALYIHSQTHGGGKAKEWACGECGRAFRWRAQLQRHLARHAGARAHPCPQPHCPRAFSVRADLLRHARTHARPPARLPCPARGCAATFAQPRYLRAHLTKKHPAAS